MSDLQEAQSAVHVQLEPSKQNEKPSDIKKKLGMGG